MNSQTDFIIIDTDDGRIKIKIKNIKYVNIEQRNLAYHLVNGETILSKCLRSSFGKSTLHLQNRENILFLPPSLIVNLKEIKAINRYSIIFNDNEIYYIPKCKYKMLYTIWESMS